MPFDHITPYRRGMAGREVLGDTVGGLVRPEIGHVLRFYSEAIGVQVLDPFLATTAGSAFIYGDLACEGRCEASTQDGDEERELVKSFHWHFSAI